MTDQTITITQADWNAEMERIHARYQAIHEQAMEEAERRFLEAYESERDRLMLTGSGLLLLLLLVIICLALQSVDCGTEMLIPPV